MPPKTHNLVKLAAQAELELSEDKKLFFDEANDFNLEAMYPDYKNEFYKSCTKDFAKEYFSKIKGNYNWLKSLIEDCCKNRDICQVELQSIRSMQLKFEP